MRGLVVKHSGPLLRGAPQLRSTYRAAVAAVRSGLTSSTTL